MILKSLTKLIGAKYKLRPYLYQIFPPHTTYIEPFGGTFGVLIGKEKSSVEVVNDISPYTVNFFRALQARPDELFEEIISILSNLSKERWNSLREELDPTFSLPVFKQDVFDIRMAAVYYIITKASVNGIVRFNLSGRCNSTYCGQLHGRGWITRDWMDRVRERMKDVKVACTDYNFILNSMVFLQGDDIFTYLDPPYYSVWTAYTKGKFSNQDHIDLRQKLGEIPGRWLLSINDHPDIREMYKDFNIVEVENKWTCSVKPQSNCTVRELVIGNYDFPEVKLKSDGAKEKATIGKRGVNGN
jgi:DNA adenine methylase